MTTIRPTSTRSNSAAQRGLVFVHPFDDPDVIAGQGTIAMEILRQHHGDEIDAIFVPVGGGGLIAGIAAYAKSLYPRIKIIGVEPEDAAGMYESLRAGKRVTLDRVGMFADGVAVRRVGEETFRLARQYVDEIILVTTDQICAAIQDIFQDTRSIAEPAGRAGGGGHQEIRGARKLHARARSIAINGGANMNFDRLRYVAERADLGAQREALFAVEIPEAPGSFLRFCELLGRRSVTEFNYRYGDLKAAQIFVGLALTQGKAERDELLRSIAAAGFAVARHDRQRNGQAARALHGGRSGARPHRRAAVPIRVSGASRGAAQVPAGHRHRLEHQPVPLPQSRLGLRARPCRASRCPRKRAPIFYCTSTSCTTPTPKRPTIRRTRSFSAARARRATPRAVLAVCRGAGRTPLSQFCARRTTGSSAPRAFTSTGRAASSSSAASRGLPRCASA